MPTRNVVLTDYQEQFIARLVESGRYKNASEVMREAIRVFERKENKELARIQAFYQAIDAADAEIKAGQCTPFSLQLLQQIDANKADIVAENGR